MILYTLYTRVAVHLDFLICLIWDTDTQSTWPKMARQFMYIVLSIMSLSHVFVEDIWRP